MRLRPSTDSQLGTLISVLALVLAGCGSPGSQRIVGPDGSQMSHVHCGSEQSVCFRIAGELCPNGYEIKPVLNGNDGNFLVRCRTAAPVVAVQCPTPPPPRSPSTSTRSAQQAWPAVSELLNPWPRPETNAIAPTAPTKPGSTQGDFDIGY
jgi:hypothetical protein